MDTKGTVLAVGLGLAGVLGLGASVKACTIVSAGHVAVLDYFGQVEEQELPPGLYFVNPLKSTVEMDVRTKETKETLDVPTKEGLIAKLDVSILYHISPERADVLYKTVGEDFNEIIIVPVLRDGVRNIVANYGSEDLYSGNRTKISNEITDRLKSAYGARGIELESVLLRDLKLPDQVTAAIEKKIKAKQESEAMEYVLTKEKAEATRKAIEAGGIAEANKLIASGLTENYLQWKYIDALQRLAESPNNTFIIAPFDTKLTPMISVPPSK